MSAHHCHANECPAPTDPKLFMCPAHWAKVPKAMKDKVWTTYRARGAIRDNPAGWADYYEACADAVEHIAMIERKNSHNSYRVTAPNFRALAEFKKGQAHAST